MPRTGRSGKPLPDSATSCDHPEMLERVKRVLASGEKLGHLWHEKGLLLQALVLCQAAM